MVILCLFWGIIKLLSKVAVPFYVPTSNVWGFHSPHPHQHLLLSVFFIVVILVGVACDFDLHCQWLKLSAFTAKGLGSIPGSGSKIPQTARCRKKKKKNIYIYVVGFPGGPSGKVPVCQCRRRKRCEFDLWVGKIPWMRARQLTPVFLPEKIPWTEELIGLQSVRSQRVRHNWSNLTMTNIVEHDFM